MTTILGAPIGQVVRAISGGIVLSFVIGLGLAALVILTPVAINLVTG